MYHRKNSSNNDWPCAGRLNIFMFAETQSRYNTSGLQKETVAYPADGSYEIAAGDILFGIKVDPAADLAAFRVGTAAGLGDIVPDIAIAAAAGEWIQLNINAKVATTIHFSSITSNTSITFYKL